MRLDKLLTELGTGSRSEVKKYIRSGLVTVNGEVVKKPEQKVDEKKDTVCFRGNPLTYTEYEYYLFHKPAGCVTATEDNLHRTVMDYLTDTARHDLFPVGRLDIDTEGLLLITNDGALAHDLLSPAKHVSKVYYAKIDGRVTEEDVNLFENGVDIFFSIFLNCVMGHSLYYSSVPFPLILWDDLQVPQERYTRNGVAGQQVSAGLYVANRHQYYANCKFSS